MIKHQLAALLVCLPLVAVCDPGHASEYGAASTVRLSPIPGVSFDLPSGWVACDDASNTLLGNANDTFHQKRRLCIVAHGWEKASTILFHAFKPAGYPAIEFAVGQIEAKNDNAFTCDEAKRELLGLNYMLKRCDQEMATVAGQPASHYRLISKPLRDDITNIVFQQDIFQLQHLTIRTVTPLQFESEAGPQPELDQIIASFQIASN